MNPLYKKILLRRICANFPEDIDILINSFLVCKGSCHKAHVVLLCQKDCCYKNIMFVETFTSINLGVYYLMFSCYVIGDFGSLVEISFKKKDDNTTCQNRAQTTCCLPLRGRAELQAAYIVTLTNEHPTIDVVCTKSQGNIAVVMGACFI